VKVKKGFNKPFCNLIIFRNRRKRFPLALQSGNSDFDALGLEGMDEEHRIANRHRVLKGGRIHFGGGSIDCTVRNISEAGAALDVTSPLGIPAEFTLVTDGEQRHCRVIWRKEKRIGVTFDKEKGES
jgi:PilZ domain